MEGDKSGKKLYRSSNKMISGVCAGIAEYFSIDPTIVRIIWAFFSLFSAGFPGILLYIICAIVIPSRDGKNTSGSEPTDEELRNAKDAKIEDQVVFILPLNF